MCRTGAPIGASERDDKRGTLKTREELLKEKQKAIAEGRPSGPVNDRCMDCYGAGEPGECCNTCESVRNAYRCAHRGGALRLAHRFSPCWGVAGKRGGSST